ncbi:hypothetical protein POTOM_056723 [Populus tomentosa]|uniref:Uncharacterized protein n=1 Tax=Populus tomentosa TaxID=118781 RepID=A0A8X7XXK3_POPTO|nr:hypothetical protein POTOM_056723 [Populus tomentosa]
MPAPSLKLQVVLTENKTTGIGIATSELSESTEKPFAFLSSLHHEQHLLNLKKSLKGLRESQSDDERARLGGGLLTEHSVPQPMSSSPDLGEQAVIAPSLLPVSVIHKLQAILGRLRTNNRLEKCVSIYVEVCSSNVRASCKPFLGVSIC